MKKGLFPMACKINKPTSPYTQIPNSFLQNKKLSWKARGLMSYMMSLPHDWEFYFRDLQQRATDGESSLLSGIKELEENNYLIRKRRHNERGNFIGHEYILFPNLEKPNRGFPEQQNPDVLNKHNNKKKHSRLSAKGTSADKGKFGIDSKLTTFYNECAIKLADAVLRHLKVNYKSSIPSWGKEFEKLERLNGVDRSRIKKVLEWFCNHLSTKGISHAFSGSHFRMKFVYIEQAMLKDSPPTVEVSEKALKITDKLKKLHWPKGSAKQLPQLVETSLQNYHRLLNRHSLLLKSLRGTKDNKDKSILRFAKTKLTSSYSPPCTFIRQWFEDVNNQVSNWDNWSGNLKSFVFQDNSDKFNSLGRSWSTEYTGSESRWEEYQKALEKVE
jgi:hypothetical protein